MEGKLDLIVCDSSDATVTGLKDRGIRKQTRKILGRISIILVVPTFKR